VACAPLATALARSRSTRSNHRRAVEIGDEPIDVEPKLCGVADQILALQRVLTVNTKSSHGQNIP
jgi:hypothetical protein